MKLIVEHLVKSYGQAHVLTDASFSFEKGKIYGLLGRNGAGKTTMFDCLTGNTETDGGAILLQEESAPPRPVGFEDIGYVFTQPHLPEFMTGHEFLKYFIEINKDKFKEPVDIDRAFATIDFKMPDRHKLIREYSHGMQNKLQILAFLLLRPPVILLDEPLTSFDVVVALQIKNLIKSIRHQHIIIFSTHILQLAQDLCDEIVILHNGKLAALDRQRLHDKDFEQQIIEMLIDKDETNA